MKNLNFFHFCVACVKYRALFDVTRTNIEAMGPCSRPYIVEMTYHKLCNVLGQRSAIFTLSLKSNTHPWFIPKQPLHKVC